MSVFHDAMGMMARAAADSLLDQLGAGFGAGSLVMTMDPTLIAGTASELGYVLAIPPTLTFDLVHGRALGIVAEKMWELIVSASEMESAADDGGYADVVTMVKQIQKMKWLGKELRLDTVEAEAIGGAAYFYRLHAKEIG